MNNQNFINFTDTSVNQGKSTYGNEEDRNMFKEIFLTLYGAQNTSYLKEDYLYFDKYGKQREIDIAIFTERRKIAVILEGKESNVIEEYKQGDMRIVEVSLASQGWEIYYWANQGKLPGLRKKTIKELQALIGKEPKFLDHMNVALERPHKANMVTPLLIVIALSAAVVHFPKISDKLFSTTRVSESKIKSDITVNYKKLGIKDVRVDEDLKKEDF